MEYIQPAGIVGLVLLCLGLVRMMNGRLNKKVNRDVCHTAQNAIKDLFNEKIGNVKEDVTEIKCDVKKLLQRNGLK